MKASKFIFSSLILIILICTGCTSADQNTSIEIEVDPDPPTTGPSVLVASLSDQNGNSIVGAQVNGQGSMSHEGMQPIHASFREVGDGKYETPFEWNMAGEWKFTITVALSNGGEVSQEFDFSVEEEHEHGDHAGEHPPRVPNEGAKISITSPQDDMQFNAGEDIPIEVEFENFDLTEEGNHWHIYINGQSYQMVMGGMNNAIVRDLEPGHHEISAYMSIGTHEELEEGDSIHITIAEP
jgi:hypothetical protein